MFVSLLLSINPLEWCCQMGVVLYLPYRMYHLCLYLINCSQMHPHARLQHLHVIIQFTFGTPFPARWILFAWNCCFRDFLKIMCRAFWSFLIAPVTSFEHISGFGSSGAHIEHMTRWMRLQQHTPLHLTILDQGKAIHQHNVYLWAFLWLRLMGWFEWVKVELINWEYKSVCIHVVLWVQQNSEPPWFVRVPQACGNCYSPCIRKCGRRVHVLNITVHERQGPKSLANSSSSRGKHAHAELLRH